MTNPSVFLAHSSANKRFARRLADDLREHYVRVWIDEAELCVGDSLIGAIERAIDDVDFLAVVLSPEAVSSEWVRRETEQALTGEIAGKALTVLPVLWRPCVIPGFLRPKLRADLSTPSRYVRDFPKLLTRTIHDGPDIGPFGPHRSAEGAS